MTETTPLIPVIISTGAVLLAAITAAAGGLFMMLRSLNASMKERFSDMQRAMNQRFDDAQKANDQAHAQIGENIKNLEHRLDNHERQVNASLDRLYTLLAAVTPRAAAEKPGPETDR